MEIHKNILKLTEETEKAPEVLEPGTENSDGTSPSSHSMICKWVCHRVILPSNGFPQFMCYYETAREDCSAKYTKKQLISL